MSKLIFKSDCPFYTINFLYFSLVIFSFVVSFININNILKSGYFVSFYIIVLVE